jgi:hypothetical protein
VAEINMPEVDVKGEELAHRIAECYAKGELTQKEVRDMMNRAIAQDEVDPVAGWFELQAVGAV